MRFIQGGLGCGVALVGIFGMACAPVPQAEEGNEPVAALGKAVESARPSGRRVSTSAPSDRRWPLLAPASPGLTDVQGRVAEEAYRAEPRQGALVAENPRQGFVSTSDRGGWTIRPQLTDAARAALSKLDPKAPDHERRRLELLRADAKPDWSLVWRFHGFGRLDAKTHALRAVTAWPATTGAATPTLGDCDGTGRQGALGRCFRRVELRREGLTEYLVNEPRGVEHGYIVHERPSGTGDLVVSTRVSGLEARITDGGQAVVFKDGRKDRLRYAELLVTDASGQRLTARMALAGDRLRILVDDRDAAYPVHIDPLATTPTPVLQGEGTNNNFGSIVASAGDVNGDGFADVLVSAPRRNSYTGRAYVFHGSATGLSTTAAWTRDGQATNSFFSLGIASAGDVNGDGFSDVVVGAFGQNSGAGRAYLFLGSATGLSTTAAWTRDGEAATNYFGGSLASCDVNGDGFSDIIVGADNYNGGTGRAYFFLGSATGLSTSTAWIKDGEGADHHFGVSVASAGDVNGDGFADVVVGAHGFNGYTGRAYLFLGSAMGLATSAAWSRDGEALGNWFGVTVASAGDVNGDGFTDVVVGASRTDSYTGRAYLFLGSTVGLATTAAWTKNGEGTDSHFGISVASAGDVNGDGFADVIVGAYGYNSIAGRAYVFLGSATGLATNTAWTGDGEATNSSYGYSVASAGDVNGDGYADIVVGAASYGGWTGRAYIYLGSAAGLATTSGWTGTGEGTTNYFGASVASAGDVNGDGHADVIVGAYGYGGETGRAYVFLGSPAGLSATAVWTASGEAAGSIFGYRVASAGDVNGDGYADVIVSAPVLAGGVGRAYLYLGSHAGPTPSAAWVATGEGTSNYFGVSVASAGDVNGDGFADVLVGAYGYASQTGRAYVYLGSPTGLSNSAAWTKDGETPASSFGTSAASAGDVNGDGFSDVVVGAQKYGSETGRAYLFLGSAMGPSATAAWSQEGESAGSAFGWSVASAGDVNGDGFADVIVGAHGSSSGAGRAYVFLGSVTGLATVAAWSRDGEATNDDFGYSVASAGDVNGDGFADVIVGARVNSSAAGRAYVFQGSATGLSTAAAWSRDGEASDNQFGFCVASAGDVNGDGFADVLVGAIRYGGYTGRAYLFYGNERTLADPARGLVPRQRLRPPSAPERPLHPLNLVAGDSEPRIALLGRSSRGRSRVKLEWELKEGAAPFDGSGRQRSPAWVDTGVPGSETWVSEPLTGLASLGRYHWRARLLYFDGGSSPWMVFDRGAGVTTPDFRHALILKTDGEACSDGAECGSNWCVDLVCCDAACGGECQACLAARTGAPDGTCAPVFAGTDPDLECGAGAECGDQAGVPACVCPSGTFGDGHACTPCPAGTWSDAVGATLVTACQACPVGTFNPLSGSDRASACLACEPGAFAASTGSASCASCAAGTYQPIPGQTTCLACGPGFYSPTAGQAVCSPCATGSFAASAGSASCTPCDAGYFASMPGQTICLACAPGSFAASGGSASCAPCALGTAQAASGQSVCVACVAGTYQAMQGQTACLACDAGYYSPTMGQAACLICEPGWVSSAGETACHALCGDGLRVGSEGCDDGNVAPQDGCSSTCQVEPGWLCPEPGEACLSGCEIEGVLYTAELPNPANECQACRPGMSRIAWSSREVGTPCTGDGLACTADRCDGAGACIHPVAAGCLVAGACVTADATDPGNPCAACLPALRADDYSDRAAGVACPDDGLPFTMDVCDGAGGCVHPTRHTCVIDGDEYEGGAPNPANPCQACDPGVSQDVFSNRVTGYPCAGDGLACTWDRCDGAGQCEHQLYAGCLVEGICVADRALDPAAPCGECNPALDTAGYSPRAAGVSCPDDGLSHTLDLCDAGGSCVHPAAGSCAIDAMMIEGGAPNPANPCQHCDPVARPSAWSDRVSGYPCVDDGLSCTWDACDGVGHCEHSLTAGCLVEGACLGYGAQDAENECLSCDPTLDATGFSPRPVGVPCADDGLETTSDTCDGAGVCTHELTGTCEIGGTRYLGGAANPANPCQVCAPAVTPTAWTSQVAGYPCVDDGLSCTGDRCDTEGSCTHPLVTGCLIAGACVALHAADPADPCRWCDPTLATDTYSPRAGCGQVPDSGVPDGGAPDGGDATDIGRCGPGTHLADGFCVVDGGGKGGCGCDATGAGPWPTAFFWLGLAWLLGRRRRRRP